MLLSSSTSTNESIVSAAAFSLYSMDCYISKPASFIFITTNVANIIPLPIIIFIMVHVVKKWRQNATNTSVTTVSHSDIFTYHMVIIELIGVFASILLISVSIIGKTISILLATGALASFLNWYGQTFFHVLTCLERYLAVVHPITYRSLRSKRGIQIRNLIIGGVWVLCFVWTSLLMTNMLIIPDFCFYAFSLLIVSYCSIFVLCVLIHPGPGEQGGGRERVDKSKQRAFYTIVAILGILVVRFSGSLVWKLVFTSVISNGCLVMASVAWCNLPSILVLPLLFLHRSRK